VPLHRQVSSHGSQLDGADVTGARVGESDVGAEVTGAGVTGAGVAGAKVDGVNTYVSVPKQGDPEGGVAITFTSVVKDEPLHKSIVFVSVTVTDSPGWSEVTSRDPTNETVTPLCVLVRSVRSIAEDPVLVMTYVYVTSTMQSVSVAGGGIEAHSVLSGPTQVRDTSTKQTPTGAVVTGASVMGAGVTGAGVFCICGAGVTGGGVT